MNIVSEFHNYDNGYIARVNVTLQNTPEKLDVKGQSLLLKGEFHISLICAKRIAALIDPENKESLQAEILAEFKKFILKHELKDFSLLPEFRFVEMDTRKTLIILVEVPDLDLLFTHLEEKYGTKLPLQPTHITLYTLQPEAGIGILSHEELEQYSELVEVPELEGLKIS